MGQGRVIGSRTTGLPRWRVALVQLVLAAFVLQSFVIQTHIHFAPAVLAQLTGKSDSHHDHWPANDDPANCPICQELLHSGQFVTPAAQFLLPPTLAVSTIAVVDEALPFVFAPSHNWQGRAPPRI
jgi:hypothetical protein